MLKRTQKKNYKNRNEICEKIFLVLKRHRCIHSFQPKIPCLRQHKQAVTLHLDDRALGFPFLLEPSERGSCRKHHLLERKRDREGGQKKKGQGIRSGPAQPCGTRVVHPPAPPPPQPHPGIPVTGLGTDPAQARHSPDTATHLKVSSPPASAGRRETGVPPPPAPTSLAGHPAKQLSHCSRVPAPQPGQWRSPRLPLRPIAKHNGRAVVSWHGPARRPPCCQPPPALPRTDGHTADRSPANRWV